MIFTAVMAVVTAFSSLVFAILPTWTPFTLATYEYTGPDGGFGGYGVLMNHFLPITLAITIFELQLGLWAAYLLYQGTVWLLTKLHILGGSSD